MHKREVILALAAAALPLSTAGVANPVQPAGYEVVHGWPILPSGEILGSATGVGIDSRDNVVVFHRAGRVWTEPLPRDTIKKPTIAVFDGRTGALLKRWGDDVFAMPHGLTVDDDDNVWLTDVSLHQVFKFSADGQLLMTIGERGVPGADGKHFNRPTDVAVLPDGSFYVSDGYINTRVAKFSPSGAFLFQWGRPGKGPGEFNTPHAITVDGSGRVYVADRQNDRVQVFDARGEFLAQWKGAAIGRPYSLALRDTQHAVIVDGGEQPSQGPDRSGAAIVSLDGTVLNSFGRYGNYDGQFRMAHDVAIAKSGAVYIVDISGQRVQKFSPKE